jgi:hypothetical protein
MAIIMQPMWHLNIIAQTERDIKLLPQTHSPEVDYSLFIMVAVLGMLERLEKRLGATLAAFPPPIFTGTTFVLCFSATSSRERLGGGVLYIGFFRSS